MLDLGKYAHPGAYYSQAVPFFPVSFVKSKKAMLSPPTLRFNLEVTWTHFNKKMLVKKEGSTNGATEKERTATNDNVVTVTKKEGAGKLASVEVGEEEFDLKTVDNELSDDETTTGWSDDEEEGDPFSSDEEDGKQKGKGKGKGQREKANGVSIEDKSLMEREQKGTEEREKQEREGKEREDKKRKEKERKAKEEKDKKRSR